MVLFHPGMKATRHRGTGRSGPFQNPPPKSPAARLRTAGSGYLRPAPPIPARAGNPGARGPDHHPGPASAAGPDGTDGQRRDSAAAPATGPRATIRTRKRPAPPARRRPGPAPRHASLHHPVSGNPVLGNDWSNGGLGQVTAWERLPAAGLRILYLSREVGVRPEIGTAGTAPPGGKPLIGGEKSGLYSRPSRPRLACTGAAAPCSRFGGQKKTRRRLENSRADSVPGTLLAPLRDSTRATRTYPRDSTRITIS